MDTNILHKPTLKRKKVLLNKIILYNDEFNTFDHVIDTLIKYCHHTPEQAEQCAWLVHYKGKYPVKEGLLDELLPICVAILSEGISATVD